MYATKHTEGFTLIELLVVLAIVALLLSVAAPRYFQSVEHAKQTVLAENLRQTREIIDKFFADSGRYPETLDELVEKNYLKALPFDPVAASATSWVLVAPKPGYRGKVYDLRSGAQGADRYGRAFAEL
jgi:general secretion pathway protein G